jgi:hypothetical protein
VRIRARDWRNAFTEVPAAAGGLIFKTHDGKIVKIQFSSDGRASGASAVAPAGGDFPDAALRGTHARIEAIAAGPSPHGFSARVGYADSIVTTTGTATALFAETALPFRTPFVPVPPAARVIVSPQPYTLVQVTWLLDGKQISQAPLTSAVQLAFDRAGRSTLSAQIGPPISTTVTIPVIAYDSLVVGCGAEVQGVRFERGHAVPATDAQSSDLFVSSDPQRFACGRNAVLNFPGGGVMLTNGHDEAHPIPNGAVAGPQFPNLTRAFWRNTTTQLAGDTWDALADPCTIPESPGVERIDWNCKTLPARTLLFRTRGGAYVKLLLVHANGTMLMGGPYQVLSE